MTKRCPDCLAVSKLQTDYPSSFMESLLKSIGLVRVKRCSNCNAAVFVVLGLFTTSRKKVRVIKDRAFWVAFVVLLLVVGYVVFEAIVS
jgi:hypothetical protein